MQSLILTLHIIVCVLLVILILLQSGKEGMGVIFGGGNTSVFGSTGAGGILVKLTTFMALVFVVTSLSYTYVTSDHQKQESTILDVQIEDVKKAQPASPENVPPVVAPKENTQAPVAPTTSTEPDKQATDAKAVNDSKAVDGAKKDMKENKAADAPKKEANDAKDAKQPTEGNKQQETKKDASKDKQ
ncbi:MAG: preprotein translocase subunit SecG [Desulfovibrionaceae bacterium]|nr:preprotein translocase subunit SecG [Desulfovibrionaceae bacterium]